MPKTMGGVTKAAQHQKDGMTLSAGYPPGSLKNVKIPALGFPAINAHSNFKKFRSRTARLNTGRTLRHATSTGPSLFERQRTDFE
jgi:hypothetical protein